MTEQPCKLAGARDEAAYRFAVKLANEGRLPNSQAKDYNQQMAKLRQEFDQKKAESEH